MPKRNKCAILLPMLVCAALVWFCVSLVLPVELAQSATAQNNPTTRLRPGHTALDDIYWDQSHCLTRPEIRNDEDAPISCFCRDAIVDARYLYLNYFLPGKDDNLSGIVLTLQEHSASVCGRKYNVYRATEEKDWKWNGPEVVRTYPSDDVIERIRPEMKNGKPVGRWVPFTVQLIYRDAQGRIERTENYASRELDPVLTK